MAWEGGYWSLTYGPEYKVHHAWAILTQYSQDITGHIHVYSTACCYVSPVFAAKQQTNQIRKSR